ncbi:hypothetical protein PV328_000917 [Microctonus aethiopoides]|uniref:Uncharacterized protein n=1 Tax=Microctonus aethiopoides TaxID=144406 RepID=A0AA39FVV6_9HYME|nr:hypothetical protein PV328_000917 [Microctonus aethiopoides]
MFCAQSITFQNGFGVFSKNINNLGASFNSLIGATNQLIDDGFAAGRQYGMTMFQGVMIVPKSIADLAMAMTENNAYINVNAARSLSYVNGRPNYLFQFVDEQGRIIPVTASVANKLVPNINV